MEGPHLVNTSGLYEPVCPFVLDAQHWAWRKTLVVYSLSRQLAWDAVFGVFSHRVHPRFSHAGNKSMKPLLVSLLKMNPWKYGKQGAFTTNRVDQQELSALSLHLLQSCLVFVNTLLIQRVLAEPEQFQRMQQEDLRGLTPLIYSHVTPYGMFRLDLSERIEIEEGLSA
jgi:hypothetical protein